MTKWLKTKDEVMKNVRNKEIYESMPTKEETLKDLKFALENAKNESQVETLNRMIDSLNTRMVEGI